MAKITPSAIIGSISGRIGGVEFAQTRNGIIVRKIGPKPKPTSTYAYYSRAQFQAATQYWATLPAATRAAWAEAAKQTTRTGALGQGRTFSGFTLYLHYWLTGYWTRRSFSTLPVQPIVCAPEFLLLASFSAAGTYTLNVYPGVEAGSVSCAVYGGPMTTLYQGARPKRLTLLTLQSRASFPINLYSAWISHWAPLQQGQSVFLEVRSYLAQRLWSGPIFATTTVTA